MTSHYHRRTLLLGQPTADPKDQQLVALIQKVCNEDHVSTLSRSEGVRITYLPVEYKFYRGPHTDGAIHWNVRIFLKGAQAMPLAMFLANLFTEVSARFAAEKDSIRSSDGLCSGTFLYTGVLPHQRANESRAQVAELAAGPQIVAVPYQFGESAAREYLQMTPLRRHATRSVQVASATHGEQPCVPIYTMTIEPHFSEDKPLKGLWFLSGFYLAKKPRKGLLLGILYGEYYLIPIHEYPLNFNASDPRAKQFKDPEKFRRSLRKWLVKGPDPHVALVRQIWIYASMYRANMYETFHDIQTLPWEDDDYEDAGSSEEMNE